MMTGPDAEDKFWARDLRVVATVQGQILKQEIIFRRDIYVCALKI